MSRKKSNKAKRVQLTRDQLMNREHKKSVIRQIQSHDLTIPPAPVSGDVVEEAPKLRKFPGAELPKGDAALLTVADLCGLLKISRTTLFRLEKSGEIPGRVSLGGQVRYHRETVEEWLRSLVRR